MAAAAAAGVGGWVGGGVQTKFTNANVAQGQHFMAQCVVEIFGLDLNVAYEVGPAISPKRNLSRNRRAAIRQPQCAIRNKPAVVEMLGGPQRLPRRRVRS